MLTWRIAAGSGAGSGLHWIRAVEFGVGGSASDEALSLKNATDGALSELKALVNPNPPRVSPPEIPDPVVEKARTRETELKTCGLAPYLFEITAQGRVRARVVVPARRRGRDHRAVQFVGATIVPAFKSLAENRGGRNFVKFR